MNDLSDAELLKQFVSNDSEAAFAVLVERHLGLVHSVALRQTNDPQHAQDIAQAVFIILARKAATLDSTTVLPGWLYHTARLTAANFHRAEWRRARREQEAFMQSNPNEDSAEDIWRELSPQLETAMAKLGPADRDALVLRYFQNRSMTEVGTALGCAENTAQQRVGRALEKLRKLFGKRGIPLTAGMIAAALSAHAVQAAPAGLAKAITVVAFTKGATASISTVKLVNATLKIMLWSNLTFFLSLMFLHLSSAIGLCVVFARSVLLIVKREDLALAQDEKSPANQPPDRRHLKDLRAIYVKQFKLFVFLAFTCFLSYHAPDFWFAFHRDAAAQWEPWRNLVRWTTIGVFLVTAVFLWRALGGWGKWKERISRRNDIIVKQLWESDPNPVRPTYYFNDLKTTFKLGGWYSFLPLLGLLMMVASFICMVRGAGAYADRWKAPVIFLAGFVLGVMGSHLRTRQERKRWLPAVARCLKHVVKWMGEGRYGGYVCIAICEYEYAGIKYRVTPMTTPQGMASFPTAEAAELHWNNQISPGGTCQLRFNPDNPLQAELVGAERRLTVSDRPPIPKRAKQVFGALFLMTFVALIWSAISGCQACRALSWPATTGTMLECNLKQGSSGGGPDGGGGQTWTVQMLYSYEVAGKQYENERVAFGYGSDGNLSYHRTIYEKLRNASSVMVRYDPNHPAVATLVGGVESHLLTQLVFALTFLSMITVFFVLFKRASAGIRSRFETWFIMLFIVGGILLIGSVIIFNRFPGMDARFPSRIQVLK